MCKETHMLYPGDMLSYRRASLAVTLIFFTRCSKYNAMQAALPVAKNTYQLLGVSLKKTI